MTTPPPRPFWDPSTIAAVAGIAALLTWGAVHVREAARAPSAIGAKQSDGSIVLVIPQQTYRCE